MRKVVLICPSFRFSKIEFKKPPYYIVKTISDIYNIDAEIVYDNVFHPYFYKENEELDLNEYNGVKINCIANNEKSKRETFNSYKKYLNENAKDIKVLICFHGDKRGIILCNLFKKYNRNGRVLILLDCSSNFRFNCSLFAKIKKIIRKLAFFFRFKSFIKNVDYFAAQTKCVYDFFRQKGWNGFDIKDKLIYLPYGYDEKEYNVGIPIKEKIIITVGRIGTYPKNSEMVLDALSSINLGEWKFIFVGPIEESFKPKIDDFYLNCPHNKNNVEFVGAIDDVRGLVEYYNKASVFVLSSRYESFALVLIEASVRNCFLLSTRVGCAEDIIKKGLNGFIFDDKMELIDILTRIINDEISLESTKDVNLTIRDNYSWNKIIENSIAIKKMMNE